MSNIIPFENGAKLPAYLAKKNPLLADLNRDVVGAGPSFTTLSIKGKVFTLAKGSEKKVLTREIDGEEEPVQSLQVAVVRANVKSRVFYAAAYVEGDSDGAKPTCFSHDGISPDPASTTKQSKKCQGCPQNVWGVRDGKGHACSTNTRLAMIDPNHMGEPFLLRVPPASRAAYNEVCKAAAARDIPYNAIVLRMGFDKDAPAPKLTFKIAGLLDDTTYAKVSELYEDDLTKTIVGVHEAPIAEEHAATEVGVDELEAAIAAKQAVKQAKAAPVAPAPDVTYEEDEAPAPAPKAVAEKAAKPAKAKSQAGSPEALFDELDALLGNKDD